MKTPILALFFFLAAYVPAAAQTNPTGPDGGISSTWNAPVDSVTGNAAPTLCSATVKLSCLSSYTETFQPPASTGAGPTAVTVANNLTTSTWRPGGPLYCGVWTLTLVANWVDNLGGTSPSTPITTTATETCSVTTKPNPPTNLKATLIQ